MGDVLVWLEDRPAEIEDMVKRATMSGFVVEIFRKPVQVADFLAESGKGVAGLVVDVMLFGVNDLSDLGIPASDTEAGYDAGWLFVDRCFFAHEAGPMPIFQYLSSLSDEWSIPIKRCVTT